MSSVGVFTGLLSYQNKELSQKCVKSLLYLLYHSFPKVRKLTAEKLYTSLLTMEDYNIVIQNEDYYNAVIEQLSETNWADPLKQLITGKD